MLPSMSEYREALQHPQIAFKEPDLKQGVVEQTPLGLPKLVSGGFALTARVTTQTGGRQSAWAIRCFHKHAPDLQDRYNRISEFLQDKNEEFFVNFNYEPEGIRVGSNWYPIVRMDWVEGQPFHEFVEANLRNSSCLQNLAEQIKLMSKRLSQLGMAHGDLQHGNILVRDGKLVLIDYDGMYVPKMPYKTSNETGLSTFQHPKRDKSFFNETIDHFSSIAIYISLLCLATSKGQELWRHHNGENLIFTQQDYLDPFHSTLFAEIQGYLEDKSNRELKVLIDIFQQICLLNLESIPSLVQFIDLSPSLPSTEDKAFVLLLASIVRQFETFLDLSLSSIVKQSKTFLDSFRQGVVGPSKTFWAHDIQLVKQEGETITVIGRVENVAVYGEGSHSVTVFIKFEAFKRDSIIQRKRVVYQPFRLVVYLKGLNSLLNIKKLSVNNLKQFEGKYLKITGLLERIEVDKSNATPQITLENAYQLLSITEEEANSLIPSPLKHNLRLLEQWNHAVKLILQRIHLTLQTARNPGRLQLIILSGAGVIGFMFVFSERDMQPFKTLVSEYQTVSVKNPEKSKRPRTKPYIKGKIIPMEIDKKGEWMVSDFFYPELPENLRTTNPENAGTIVFLKWEEDFGACKVIIIDKSLKIIVDEKKL